MLQSPLISIVCLFSLKSYTIQLINIFRCRARGSSGVIGAGGMAMSPRSGTMGISCLQKIMGSGFSDKLLETETKSDELDVCEDSTFPSSGSALVLPTRRLQHSTGERFGTVLTVSLCPA